MCLGLRELCAKKWYVYIYIYIYPPPCLSHDVECLRGPCCPREVLLIVLRGFGPPSREFSGILGIPRIYSRPGFSVKICINFLTTKMSSKDPQNQQKWCPKQSQKQKKHQISKTWNCSKTMLFTMVWAYPAPLDDTLGIKNAFRRRHTDVPWNFYWFW